MKTLQSKKRNPFFLVIASLFLMNVLTVAQGVGIGDASFTPNSSAILELSSTNKGFIWPRNSATLGFTVQGLSFYNTSTNRINYYASGWQEIPIKADKLSVFASTTSSELGGVISDETGSGGVAVFSNSPSLTSPNIGAATGTSLGLSATTNQLVLGTTNTTTINSTAPIASRVYTIPDFGADGIIPIGTAGNPLSFTTTGSTSITLPTSGTLVSSTVSTLSLLANIGTTATGAISLGNGSATGLTLNPGTTGTTLIGASAGTGDITLGSSTAAQNVLIGNGVNAGAQIVSIANGATAAASTVNILSGAGTAGTATLSMANNTRVTTIDLGNIAPAAARTTTIAGGNSTVADVVNIGTGLTNGAGSKTVNVANSASTVGANTINIGTGATTVAGGNTIHIGDGTPTGTGTNVITIGSIANVANTTTLQGGNGATAISLTPQTTGGIVIGSAAGTGNITLGSSTAAQSVLIGNGVNGSAQVVSIANGATGANSDVNILSGVGTAGVGTLKMANNTRVTTIDLGNIAPAAARTTTIAGGGSSAVDQINIGTGAATVAGGKTINIGTTAPTGSGTNLITIGSNTNFASTTTILGGSGTGAITLDPYSTGTIVIGDVAGTGDITLGSSTAAQNVLIGNGVNGGAQVVNIANGATAANSTVNILSGAGTAGAGAINIGDNVRVTTIDIGNATPSAARTTTIAGSTSAVVDRIDIGTGAATVAGGKTINIGTTAPTGSGTNLITIGSNTNFASTTTILGGSGTGAITLDPYSTGTIVIGDVAGTGDITLGSSTAIQTLNLGTGTGSTGTINIGTGATGIKTVHIADAAALANVITIGDNQTTAATVPVGSAKIAGANVITNGAFNYGVSGGAANAQTLTLTPAITGPAAGQMVCFKAGFANSTTTPTLNVNGTGAKTIVKRAAAAVAANDIRANGFYIVIYNGTQWQLINPTVP